VFVPPHARSYPPRSLGRTPCARPYPAVHVAPPAHPSYLPALACTVPPALARTSPAVFLTPRAHSYPPRSFVTPALGRTPPRTLRTCLRSFVAAGGVGVGAPAVSAAPAPAVPAASTPTPTAAGSAAGAAVVAAVPTAAAAVALVAVAAAGVSAAAAPALFVLVPATRLHSFGLVLHLLVLGVLVWAHLSISNTKLVSIIIKKLTLTIYIMNLDKNI
jgi:hypothetical protein